MIGWLAVPLALAGDVELGQVVVVEGRLSPGRIATLQVAKSLSPPSTRTAPDLSDLRLAGAALLRARSPRPGVVDLEVVPELDATEVEVRLGNERYRLPVSPEPVTPLAHAGRVAATTVDDLVDFTVTSTTTPTLTVDDVDVVASEGEVTVRRGGAPDTLELTLAPDPSSTPRVIPVVVVDHRAARRPTLVPVVLRARPRLTVNATPGSAVTISVGRRTYGPVTVPDGGTVALRVDQYPGESTAVARVSDDLGNTNTSELPLAVAAQPSLLVVPSGRWLPGEAPPPLSVIAMRPNGAPISETPRCETEGTTLAVRQIEPGWWSVVLPSGGDAWRRSPGELRVACSVGAVTRTVRVEVEPGIPARIALEVWPEDLRGDFPVAELRAIAYDARGDRVDVQGLTIDAEHGRVVVQEAASTLRGEYRGESAVEHGTDAVIARYRRPPGPGPVTALNVGFDQVPGPEGGPVVVHARALNARREPVAYVPLNLSVDGRTRSVMSEADGWASTSLEVPAGHRPHVVSASTAVASRYAVALPGEGGIGGPETSDLAVRRPVRVRAGRIAAVTVAVEPKILRAAPGSVANIVVRLEDRSGRPVTDEPVGLEASEGRIILPIDVRPDGTLVAQYLPEPGTREAREVQITATTEGFRSSTEIEIESRPARVSVGPFLGFQTNFGELQSPFLGIDVDLRTRALRDSLAIRVGLHTVWHRADATLPGIVDAQVRTNLTSFDLAAAVRDDRGPVSVWLGLGGTVAIQWDDVRFGDTRTLQGRTPVGGPMVLAGLSRRAPLGEWLFEARGYWVPATERSEIGYTGNLGGLSIGFGYRLVY